MDTKLLTFNIYAVDFLKYLPFSFAFLLLHLREHNLYELHLF